MIAALIRTLDNLVGRGEAAVTVPPLDGALRPNRKLDEATDRYPLADVDCLTVVDEALLASAGNAVYQLDGQEWQQRGDYEAEVACIASAGDGGLAVALATGEIVMEGGGFDGRRYNAGVDIRCVTAIAVSGGALYVANGSADNFADEWQLDLLQRNASGSLWRIDLDSGEGTQLADGLAWPAGIAIYSDGVVVSEAWKHRLVRVGPGNPGTTQVLYADLPGYPGRLSPADDGYWLAVFAPRSQLVEFVLREPGYRDRMVEEVPQPFWIAPKLRSGQSFYEPLQGGGVKHLGIVKPWAPAMSAGFCVRLDRDFQPDLSLHSRADGQTHGVTGIAEHAGRVFAAARGHGVVIALSSGDLADDRGDEQ